jgi:DNA-binding MarR family transcriptional regulator
MTDKVTDKVTDKMTDRMTDRKRKEAVIIEYLSDNDSITNRIACELLSVSDTTAKRLLKSMSENGSLIAEGELKGRIYRLHKNAESNGGS